MRQKRRVGRGDHDDRADVSGLGLRGRTRCIARRRAIRVTGLRRGPTGQQIGNLLADGNAIDPQQPAAGVYGVAGGAAAEGPAVVLDTGAPDARSDTRDLWAPRRQ